MLFVELGGAHFAAWGAGGEPHSIEGTRDFETLIFRKVAIGERVNDGVEVSHHGTAGATLDGGNTTGRFSGAIWLNHAGELYDVIGDCTADDHRLELVRR